MPHLGERGTRVGALHELARDLPPDLGGAGEGDPVHGRLHQRATGVGPAVQEVEDAGGELPGEQRLGEQRARPGGLLGGLDDHRVAREQRGGGHPEGERQGEVEGRDHPEDAVGPEDLGAALGGGEAGQRRDEPVVALELLGVGLDQLDRLLHLDDRLEAVLAGLQAHHRGELEVPVGDRARHGGEPLGALAVGCAPPQPAGLAGRLDRKRDGLCSGGVGAAGDALDTGRIGALEHCPLVAGFPGDRVGPRLGFGGPRGEQTALELRVRRGVDATAGVGEPHSHLEP